MADKSSATVVISENERERIDRLRVAFRRQLQSWLARLAEGVSYSPAVARALAESLIEPAIVLFLAASGASMDAEDDVEARAAAIFAKLMVVLEAEVAS